MSPTEHQAEAKKALESAAGVDLGDPQETYHLARAQVHATLALAGYLEQLKAGAR